MIKLWESVHKGSTEAIINTFNNFSERYDHNEYTDGNFHQKNENLK